MAAKYAKYVAGVSAVAVALAVTSAMAAPTVAWADDTTSSSGSSSSESTAGDNDAQDSDEADESEEPDEPAEPDDAEEPDDTEEPDDNEGSGEVEPGEEVEEPLAEEPVAEEPAGEPPVAGEPVDVPESLPEIPTQETTSASEEPELEPVEELTEELEAPAGEAVHALRHALSAPIEDDVVADQVITPMHTPETEAPAATLDPVAAVQACACTIANEIVGVIFQIGAILEPLLPSTEVPEDPSENPVMWAVLAWVRRQTDELLALPPVARLVQEVQSEFWQLYSDIITCDDPPASLPEELERTVIATGLSEPTDFRFLPDGRIVIVEKSGTIKIVENGGTAAPVIVTRLDTANEGERGLTGIELDPDFAENGYVYVAYTHGSGYDRLSRLQLDPETYALVAGSEVVLMQSDQPAGPMHHGGELDFGPDGYLYWATGDNSTNTNSQDLTNIHGKILRLDPDAYDPNDPDATAPVDNPFIDHVTENGEQAIPQIYAYGLRNPFRFTFTPDGQLLAADVGGAAYEELNIITAGGNYGWPGSEGLCTTNCDNVIDPVYVYAHEGAARAGSITSALVYTGDTLGEDYQNKVFIADFTLGWVKVLTFDENFTTVLSEQTLDSEAGTAVKLIQGPDGNVYQLNVYPGELSRIAPSGGNRAPNAVLTASPTSGAAPLSVDFSPLGTTDPDGDALTYSWDFGDGTSSTLPSPTHTYAQKGVYTAVLTVSDGAKTDTASQQILVDVAPPTVEFDQMPSNYDAGDTLSFGATAYDDEGNELPADAYTWTVLFHHADHVHPAATIEEASSGTYVTPNDAHNGADTYYTVTVTVTDRYGLTTTQTQRIDPNLTTFTVKADDPTATFTVDGKQYTGEFSETAVVGTVRQIGAPSPQAGGQVFDRWSDGGAQTHDVVTPETPGTYIVYYKPGPV